MSESSAHQKLVNIAYNYILTLIPENNHVLIERDSPDAKKPTSTGNFIPDVFYNYDGIMVIGEAKTLDDFDRTHSKAQYEEYFNCLYQGDGEKIMVVAVPWQIVPDAKNYFRLLNKKYGMGIKIIVLNEFGRKDYVE